eukprot:gene12849-biopygen15534
MPPPPQEPKASKDFCRNSRMPFPPTTPTIGSTAWKNPSWRRAKSQLGAMTHHHLGAVAVGMCTCFVEFKSRGRPTPEAGHSLETSDVPSSDCPTLTHGGTSPGIIIKPDQRARVRAVTGARWGGGTWPTRWFGTRAGLAGLTGVPAWPDLAQSAGPEVAVKKRERCGKIAANMAQKATQKCWDGFGLT